MEFTSDQLHNHVTYCGSKTRECTDCFKSVQNWMMQAHKDSGECANICLDRLEDDESKQLHQALGMSEMPQSRAATVAPAVDVPVAHGDGAGDDDGMDANEREIARILQEEASAFEAPHDSTFQ